MKSIAECILNNSCNIAPVEVVYLKKPSYKIRYMNNDFNRLVIELPMKLRIGIYNLNTLLSIIAIKIYPWTARFNDTIGDIQAKCRIINSIDG